MLIKALDLTRSFGAHRAVCGVSFGIEAATIVGLLGSNGAGKSTTMRMLTGSLAPGSGTAVIGGHDIRYEREAAQSRIGYLPEAANGFSALTVVEFLEFSADVRGMDRQARRRAVADVISLLNLEDAAGRALGTLSKGWRQRAWLAQALIHDPDVLILDEPTDGLDPGQKAELHKLLRRIAAEKAILMSTHILEEAETLCDRLIVMNGGRIVADAATSALADADGRLAANVIALTVPQPGSTSGPAA